MKTILFAILLTCASAVAQVTTLPPTTLSNMRSISWRIETMRIPTNSAASNIVVNLGSTGTNIVELWATNNLTFTNWSGLASNVSGSKLILIRPQLITRGVNWGNLGLANPGFRVAIATNANNLLWTSLTNGKTYVLSLTSIGTNVFPTLTLWE